MTGPSEQELVELSTGAGAARLATEVRRLRAELRAREADLAAAELELAAAQNTVEVAREVLGAYRVLARAKATVGGG